jgi:hypothetical protein
MNLLIMPVTHYSSNGCILIVTVLIRPPPPSEACIILPLPCYKPDRKMLSKNPNV